MFEHAVTRRAFLQGTGAAIATLGSASAAAGQQTGSSVPLVLENAHLLVELDPGTGALVRVRNKDAGLDLVDQASRTTLTPDPWRIETAPGSEETQWLTPASSGAVFSAAVAADRIDLSWVCNNGIAVEASVVLATGDVDARFTATVVNSGTVPVSLLEYPIVRGIGRLVGPGADDYLMHPYATGFLFRNPLDLFPAGGGVPPSPYPEGFNGASTQVMSYYGEGAGGFYLAVHDPTGWVKWLDFFKDGDGYLQARFLHAAQDIGAGNGLQPPYEVHIGALTDGTWYEAAERYRDWATQQPFCQRGPLRARADRARWLLEDVGFAVFGVSTQYERGPWLEYFHDLAGTPVFHITGPNWQHGRWDYLGNQNGGPETVLPAAVTDSYRATLAAAGDKFAAFTFATIFQDPTSSDYDESVASRMQLAGRDTPGRTNRLSRDGYDFDFICPVPELQTRLSAYRDARAVSELGADAVYYDIGPNNVMLRCLAADHGHGIGGGAEVSNAYRGLLARVRAACASAAGGYVPLGCEMVNELFIPEMDFYQARAEASPASSFEAYSFYDWIISGACEKVPLFAFVYHEYGPTRLDGWGRLAAEQGDLFYWLAARVFAWGGLYELDYEFTSLETLGAHRDDMTQSFSSFAVDRSYEVDPGMEAFLREIALARTGFANRYVAYGHMLRPVLTGSEPAVSELSWFHYNAPPDAMEYQTSGTLTVRSVVHSAWRYASESCGFVFVNVSTTPQLVSAYIDPSVYGLAATTGLHVFEVTGSGSVDRGEITAPATRALTLQPRAVTLLELRMP